MGVELEAGQGRSYDTVEDLWRELDDEAAGAESVVPPTVDLMAALRTSIETAKQRRQVGGKRLQRE